MVKEEKMRRSLEEIKGEMKGEDEFPREKMVGSELREYDASQLKGDS